MQEMAIEIQNVINTLQSLDIRSSYDNMNKLLGCLQRLAEVRDRIHKEAKANGNADHE